MRIGKPREPREETFSRQALIRLILPLIAEQFLAVLVGMADTAMVSGVGESAVAAVSTVDILNIMFIQLFSAMSAGGSVVAAQYLGKGDRPNACAAAKQLMLSTFILASSVTLLITTLHRPIIGLMDNNNDPSTVTQAYTYLLITAFSYPFLGIYNGGVGLLRAMGNTRTSMRASIAMNLINIGGNALLIHPCGLGVAGAGLSTLISRAISAMIILKVMFNPAMPIHLEPPRKEPHYFRLDFGMIRRIFKVGIPTGLESSLFQLGRVLIMGIITTFSTPVRAANGICNSITSAINIPGTAIGLAAISVIGQLIGADKKEEAKRYGKKLMLLMYLAILPTNLLLIFCTEPIVRMFNLSEEAVAVSLQLLRLYGVCSIITWPPSFGMPNILRAAGDARFTMVVSIVSMLVLRLGASYLLVYGLGLSLLGVWVAMHLDWVLRGTCFCWRFHKNKWLEKKVI